jgi:hypothetical protein
MGFGVRQPAAANARAGEAEQIVAAQIGDAD